MTLRGRTTRPRRAITIGTASELPPAWGASTVHLYAALLRLVRLERPWQDQKTSRTISATGRWHLVKEIYGHFDSKLSRARIRKAFAAPPPAPTPLRRKVS